MDAMRDFYCKALGMTVGPRPNFRFGGAWLYCAELPVVHLVEIEQTPAKPAELTLEHFAFRATNLEACLGRLDAEKVERRVGFVHDFRLCQVHVRDPDGNHVHLDFPIEEAEVLGLVPK
jgi:catechol 2,3-dioxygenase-like lactoylglutathione lyase family enzyme